VVVEAAVRGCSTDSAVEETGIREVVLFEMYSDQGNEFWDGVCVSCAKGKVE
jgi:hypothetical protein